MKITPNNQALYPVKEISEPKTSVSKKTSHIDDLKKDLPKINLDQLSNKIAESLLFKL